MSESSNETTPVESSADQQPVVEDKQQSVSYETHRKLLAEKKNMQAKLREMEEKAFGLENNLKDIETKKLEEQSRYKELYEQIQKENSDLKSSITERDQAIQKAIKVDAFNKALGSKKIDSKYFGFINTDNIIYDMDSNSVDELSTQKEVERVLSEFPEIVKETSAKQLPNSAPKQGIASGMLDSRQSKIEFLANAIKNKRI